MDVQIDSGLRVGAETNSDPSRVASGGQRELGQRRVRRRMARAKANRMVPGGRRKAQPDGPELVEIGRAAQERPAWETATDLRTGLYRVMAR
jgi:hypothetical protein